LLSFSGFFGSINCFKHLLMKGFEINESVLSMVVCSGCLDLFHLCQVQKFLTAESICKASEFCHQSMLEYMVENGADMNTKGEKFRTPLHLAAHNGNLSVVECLINQKAEINIKDEFDEILNLI